MIRKYLSLYLLLAMAFSATAQISYRETEKKSVQKAYDSSMAFQRLSDDIAPMTLVGQTITFLKLNPNRQVRNSEDSLLENVYKKGGVLIPYKSVLKGGRLYTPYRALENKSFKIIGCDKKEESGKTLWVFTLLDDAYKSLYYQVYANNLSNAPVVLNGYYEWLKKTYVGQKLYLPQGEPFNAKTENVLDNNREIVLDETEVFSCAEISVLFTAKQKYGLPYIIANSNFNGEVAIGVGTKNEYQSGPLLSGFWTEKQYEEYVARKIK
ncbi:hypothetical protein [Chitinophaga nivalis]|uniref:GLPGLI family protein n=1 Tax=Chitinophaga nivalis TaxID=2991709 RepID=A0ABT3IQM2_9BACT|nr:hypothetical protein [Chitinophaga nivalis]MCW3464040.1 hypothetical protein [Chitinophaga nivalis]MCW3486270.1 hypothetical protein [Chitinophaga nivalis]